MLAKPLENKPYRARVRWRVRRPSAFGNALGNAIAGGIQSRRNSSYAITEEQRQRAGRYAFGMDGAGAEGGSNPFNLTGGNTSWVDRPLWSGDYYGPGSSIGGSSWGGFDWSGMDYFVFNRRYSFGAPGMSGKNPYSLAAAADAVNREQMQTFLRANGFVPSTSNGEVGWFHEGDLPAGVHPPLSSNEYGDSGWRTVVGGTGRNGVTAPSGEFYVDPFAYQIEGTTNRSIFGIDQASVDADIAAGKTSGLDAAKYAAKVTFYELWNVASAGFLKRHDARITDLANGRISESNFWKATAFDAGGSVASVYAGGRLGGYVYGRLGAGYIGSIASGAAGAGGFDLVQQSTGLSINYMTNGQAGQQAFSWRQFMTTSAVGGLTGGAFKFAGSSELLNRPLRSPFILEDSSSVAASFGYLPIKGVQSPFVPNKDVFSVYTEAQLDTALLGTSRSVHFEEANRQLLMQLDDPASELSAMYQQQFPNLRSDILRYPDRSPSGLTWHHALSTQAQGRTGVLFLVPRYQHTPGSLWYRALHPGNTGGYAEWAIPAGAPPNR